MRIRSIHNREIRYMDTCQFIFKKYLNKNYDIKDGIISKIISLYSINKWENWLIGGKIEPSHCDGLLKYLETEEKSIM